LKRDEWQAVLNYWGQDRASIYVCDRTCNLPRIDVAVHIGAKIYSGEIQQFAEPGIVALAKEATGV
jgi:hypothetical protein